MGLRNALYDRGIWPSYSLGARTISVGNLTTGGTGKTPLVALIGNILAESGETVCVLTRGYGRANENERVLVSDGSKVLADAAAGGDEPVELARKLIGRAIVVADANRVGAAKWARERFEITVFILDDGFQHRRVKRDLNIVCIDAMKPFNGMLPGGRLREPPAGLERADAIVITRANLVEGIEDLKSQISNYGPEAVIFHAENTISGIVQLDEHNSGPNATQNTGPEDAWKQLWAEGRSDDSDEKIRLLAFCALGNPDNFFLLLKAKFEEVSMGGFDLTARKAFPDHHWYTQQDIDGLETRAGEGGINALLTTAKDAVKLRELKFQIPCYVVEIEPKIDDAAGFRQMITFS